MLIDDIDREDVVQRFARRQGVHTGIALVEAVAVRAVGCQRQAAIAAVKAARVHHLQADGVALGVVEVGKQGACSASGIRSGIVGARQRESGFTGVGVENLATAGGSIVTAEDLHLEHLLTGQAVLIQQGDHKAIHKTAGASRQGVHRSVAVIDDVAVGAVGTQAQTAVGTDDLGTAASGAVAANGSVGTNTEAVATTRAHPVTGGVEIAVRVTGLNKQAASDATGGLARKG